MNRLDHDVEKLIQAVPQTLCLASEPRDVGHLHPFEVDCAPFNKLLRRDFISCCHRFLSPLVDETDFAEKSSPMITSQSQYPVWGL